MTRAAAGSRAVPRERWFLLTLTLGIGSAYLAVTLDEGWYPWDDGSLGQMAARTLGGQLPHRDFADIYTGGLSFFDAGVFWLFGTDLLWLRVAMFPFFMLFVAATYFILLRFVRPSFAALLTAALVVWTVPNYPAAMPSWYNLFLSIFGIAAVVLWLERRRNRWLVVAGVCGGLSLLVKLVGLYYLAGIVFFLLWRSALYPAPAGSIDERGARARRVAARALAATAAAAALATIAPRLGAPELVAFVPAVGAAAAALAAAAGACGRSREPILRPVGLFLAGAAGPVVIFLAPYVLSGGLSRLLSDVFGSSHTRLNYAAGPPLPASVLVSVAPFVAVPLVGRLSKRWRITFAVLFAVGYAGLLVSHDVTRYFMNPLRESLPVLAPAAAVAITLTTRKQPNDRRTAELLALLFFVAAFDSLVQFPFGAALYFQYILPVVALAAVAFVQLVSPEAATVATVLVVAYLFAGLLHLQPGVEGIWNRLSGSAGLTAVDAHRGRILIPTSEANTLATVVAVLRRHAESGVTVAGPDAPELYYLSGLENPTPLIFDFLTPPSERLADIFAAVRRPDVYAVVVNSYPQFSPPYTQPVLAAIDARFPQHRVVGQFDVRWRT